MKTELDTLRTVAREAAAYLDLEEIDDSSVAADEGSPLWRLKVALSDLLTTFPSSLQEE